MKRLLIIAAMLLTMAGAGLGRPFDGATRTCLYQHSTGQLVGCNPSNDFCPSQWIHIKTEVIGDIRFETDWCYIIE